MRTPHVTPRIPLADPPARLMLAAGALLLATSLGSPAAAQSPAADWRTLEVPGYRVHFPAPAEAWAHHLAARLPAVRERVAGAVGWDDPETVDVLLVDPLAQANGSAFPLLGSPRMVLLLTPPEATSGLEEHGDWIELLAIHEQVHLSHLLRPSRQPLWRLARLPIGPIGTRAPRWVTEGYATLLEGRLTGRGRPQSALRAAVLRRWAQLGRLPTYGQLAGDRSRYLGMSMAYLAGSAFLEWLEAREGEGSLERLWQRLTARQGRSFEEAFRGVYGETPPALWGRFTADLTWKAVEAERRLRPVLRQGELWQDFSWGTGAPALSADGERLVVMLRGRDLPPRLAVFATAVDEAAERDFAERQARLAALDPDDVAPARRGPLRRQPLATLPLVGSTVAPTPRFLPDGSVLFTRTRPAADGVLHPDLYRWWPDSGRVDQLTREAGLKAADPSPDGTWAVAVHSRWGATSLARVDLATGVVTPLGAGSVAVIHDAPRVSPDGTAVAYLRHSEREWALMVRDLASGAERRVETPPGAMLADPAWRPGGDYLYATVGELGMLDVQALPLAAGGERHQVTRTLGATLGAAVTPDAKRLYFLSLDADGLELRTLDLDAATVQLPEAPATADLTPAVPPQRPDPPPALALSAVPASRAYGLGRAEWVPLFGGTAGPAGQSWEAGARAGDVVGRWGLIAAAALGADGGHEGGTVALAWRGWPVGLTAQAFSAEESPSRQPRADPVATAGLDGEERGLEVGAEWSRPLAHGAVGLRLAGTSSRFELAGGPDLTRRSALLGAAARRELRQGPWRGSGGLDLEWQEGETEGESWSRWGGGIELAGGRVTGTTGRLAWRRGSVDGAAHAVDALRVGGLPSTLLAPVAGSNRIVEPGLPAAALVGADHEEQRVAFTVRGGSLPVAAFGARHRVRAFEGDGWGDWLALAGLELDAELPPLPILRLPATRLLGGVAYVFDEPYRGDVNAWVGIAWRP